MPAPIRDRPAIAPRCRDGHAPPPALVPPFRGGWAYKPHAPFLSALIIEFPIGHSRAPIRTVVYTSLHGQVERRGGGFPPAISRVSCCDRAGLQGLIINCAVMETLPAVATKSIATGRVIIDPRLGSSGAGSCPVLAPGGTVTLSIGLAAASVIGTT